MCSHADCAVDVNSWQRVNRGFLNDIRKLFLVWKTMPPETKMSYTSQGGEMLTLAEADAH